MSDTIIIRKANESDLKDILAIINSPEADNGVVMQMHDANTVYLSMLEDSNYFQIIASSEQGIVGIVSLVIIMQMTHEGSTSAYITDLIIAPDENKTAIATQLLQYATDLAQEYGCYKTIVNCDYQNEPTESACRGLGFEKSTACFLLAE